jgi:hypothetical protein
MKFISHLCIKIRRKAQQCLQKELMVIHFLKWFRLPDFVEWYVDVVALRFGIVGADGVEV